MAQRNPVDMGEVMRAADFNMRPSKSYDTVAQTLTTSRTPGSLAPRMLDLPC
jgi:hypothetical protein